MPKRKSTFSARRRFRKRRKGAYRKKRFTRYRSIGNHFTCMLRTPETFIQNDATATTKFSKSFHLSDCINYSTYTTLFDQFRILKVVYTLTPVKTQLVVRPYDDTTTAGQILAIPRLTTVIDRDDTSIPVDFESIYQRPSSRSTLATRKVTYSFRPTPLAMTFQSPTQTAYKVDWSKSYLDCGDATTPHFGIKGVLEAASPAQAYTYRVETKIYLSFKNRRL